MTGGVLDLGGSIWRDSRRTRPQFSGQDGVLNFLSQLYHRIHFLPRLLAPLEQCFEFGVHSIVALQESIDFVLLDGESSLDRLFAGPIFSMCLAFHEDGIDAHTSIPAQADCLSPFGLLYASKVELQILVVKIYRGDGRVGNLKFLVGIENWGGRSLEGRGKREGHTKHRQITKYVKLQLNKVVGMHPVLCGLADESALRSACARVTFHRVPPSPYEVIEAGKLNNDRVPVVLVERPSVKIVADEGGL